MLQKYAEFLFRYRLSKRYDDRKSQSPVLRWIKKDNNPDLTAFYNHHTALKRKNIIGKNTHLVDRAKPVYK